MAGFEIRVHGMFLPCCGSRPACMLFGTTPNVQHQILAEEGSGTTLQKPALMLPSCRALSSSRALITSLLRSIASDIGDVAFIVTF
jgi:hypothetical protein